MINISAGDPGSAGQILETPWAEITWSHPRRNSWLQQPWFISQSLPSLANRTDPSKGQGWFSGIFPKAVYPHNPQRRNPEDLGAENSSFSTLRKPEELHCWILWQQNPSPGVPAAQAFGNAHGMGHFRPWFGCTDSSGSHVLKFHSWRSRASKSPWDKLGFGQSERLEHIPRLPFFHRDLWSLRAQKSPLFPLAQLFAQPQDCSNLIPSPLFPCLLLFASQNIQLPGWELTGLNKLQPPLHLLLKQQQNF